MRRYQPGGSSAAASRSLIATRDPIRTSRAFISVAVHPPVPLASARRGDTPETSSMASVTSTRALSASRRLLCARPTSSPRPRGGRRPAPRRPNHAGKCLAYFDDPPTLAAAAAAWTPSPSRSSSRPWSGTDLEGEGAERLNKTAGLLLDASGRAIDKDERRRCSRRTRPARRSRRSRSPTTRRAVGTSTRPARACSPTRR